MALLDLAGERFVSLTTFRRSGEPVSTPVWVARDGEALVVLTPAGSGKVRRLRADARVELRPCSRFGQVAPGTPATPGSADVLEQPADEVRARAVIAAKYPVESRVVLGLERLAELVRGRPRTARLSLRIH